MISMSIQRLSRFMIALCWGGIIGFPIFQLWFWLFNPNSLASLKMTSHLKNTDVSQTSEFQILLALVLSLGGALILSYGLFRLYRMFCEFIDGHFFTKEAIGHLHAFSFFLFVSVIYRVIQTGLMAAVLTWHNPPGQRQMVLSLGSQELSTLFVAGLLLTITWCFREANRIDVENKEFV